jgi:signal transduction histidine kinase/ActR/RegA family two-component response regulator
MHIQLTQQLTKKWQDLSLGMKGVILNALPLTVLLASLTSLYFKEQQAAFLEDKLRNTIQTQRDIQAVHTQLVEASTGVRDYLLTGDKAFLKIYVQAYQKLPQILRSLEQKFEDPEQQARIRKIVPLVKKNLADLKVLADKNLSNVSREIIDHELINKFESQSKTLNELRVEIEALGAREAILVAHEQAEVNAERQSSINFTMLAASAGVLGSLIGAWVFSNTIVRRVRQIRDSAAHLARGEPLALPSISRDELGQLSEELDHASQLLAKRAGEAHLARIEAEEASHAKSNFLSRTSHELRTPLNAILGFAQLLESDLPEGRQKNSANLIIGAGKHLLKLINEVLDIARIESGDIAMYVSTFNLADLLDETTNYIRPLGKIRDIEIQTSYEKDMTLCTDRQKLMQVILNLLSNALKYGPENAVVLLRAYEKNEEIFIEVEDTGKGIAPERRTRVFTPFDRLGAEKTTTEGTGLGLALSKQMMDAMGGSITISDQKSVFTLSLPKKNHAQETQTIVVSPINQSAQAPTPPTTLDATKTKNVKLNVLYVEDNASNRALVEAIVKRHHSLKLHLANNLKEGLHYLKNIAPDLFMIDLHLPDGTGEVLIQAIKNDVRFKTTPILVLSADAMPETIARVKKLDITEYFTKPLDIARFNQYLQQLLALQK